MRSFLFCHFLAQVRFSAGKSALYFFDNQGMVWGLQSFTFSGACSQNLSFFLPRCSPTRCPANCNSCLSSSILCRLSSCLATGTFLSDIYRWFCKIKYRTVSIKLVLSVTETYGLSILTHAMRLVWWIFPVLSQYPLTKLLGLFCEKGLFFWLKGLYLFLKTSWSFLQNVLTFC